MRIWTFKEEAEEEIAVPRMGRRRWRKVLIVDKWSIRLVTELAYPGTDGHEGSEWSITGCDYHSVYLWRRWKWGEDHMYYDGPHCMFSIGYLHFSWSGDWCEKCMPSRKDGSERR